MSFQKTVSFSGKCSAYTWGSVMSLQHFVRGDVFMKHWVFVAFGVHIYKVSTLAFSNGFSRIIASADAYLAWRLHSSSRFKEPQRWHLFTSFAQSLCIYGSQRIFVIPSSISKSCIDGLWIFTFWSQFVNLSISSHLNPNWRFGQREISRWCCRVQFIIVACTI